MTESTPVIDAKNEPVSVSENKTPINSGTVQANKSANTPSPAQDLRNIQMLLVSGIFPGNVAPHIVMAHKLLEDMAQKIEKEAGFSQEVK